MKTVAVVPLSARARMKTRLAPVLDQAEREALVFALAGRVLAVLGASPPVDETLVVSPDQGILDWATRHGAIPVLQTRGDLNDGLEVGRRQAIVRGASQLLVIFADLPLLTGADVSGLFERLSASHPVVIAADRRGQGTNALVQRPATALPFAFGQGSATRYRKLAEAVGIVPAVCSLPGTRFDVDTPADLERLRQIDATWPAAVTLAGER